MGLIKKIHSCADDIKRADTLLTLTSIRESTNIYIHIRSIKSSSRLNIVHHYYQLKICQHNKLDLG